MKPTMHLYEPHLPVKDTEVSSRFYVDVVGLEYAHRDLTRDVVFLWIGSKKRSMLVCGVPLRLRGNFIVVTLLSLSPCPTCLRLVYALAPSASLHGIFRANVQPNHRSSDGCHRRRFSFPTPTAIPLNTLRCLMKCPSASLSVRFQPGRRD